jgi:hypothetical protein
MQAQIAHPRRASRIRSLIGDFRGRGKRVPRASPSLHSHVLPLSGGGAPQILRLFAARAEASTLAVTELAILPPRRPARHSSRLPFRTPSPRLAISRYTQPNCFYSTTGTVAELRRRGDRRNAS